MPEASDPNPSFADLEPLRQRFIDGTFAGTRGSDIFVYDELSRRGPLTAAQLADRLDIDERTAHRSLRRLQDDELAERQERAHNPGSPVYVTSGHKPES